MKWPNSMHTRLLLLILCFILGFIQESDAQYRKRYKRGGTKLDIRYGVKLGYQNSSFKGDQFLIEFDSDNKHIYPSVTYKGYGSFHIGAYMDVRVAENFIIQPEFQFVSMGTKMIRPSDLNNPEGNYTVTTSSNPFDIIDVPIQRRLSYLQLPIIAKIGFNRQIHVNVGPVLSFKIGEQNVYGDIADTLVTRFNYTDPSALDLFKGLDYGGILGISYQMNNGLNFSLRYNRNFGNINKNEGLNLIAREPKNTTQAILISLGFTFQYDQRLRQSIGRRY